jgi:hypothetical protein
MAAGIGIQSQPCARNRAGGGEKDNWRRNFRRVKYITPFDTTKSSRIDQEVYGSDRRPPRPRRDPPDLPAGLARDAVLGDDGAGHDHRRLAAMRRSVSRLTSRPAVVPPSHRGGRCHRRSKAPPIISSRASGHDAISAMDAVRTDHRHHAGLGLPASGVSAGLTGRMYFQFALVIAATARSRRAVNAATLKPTQCALAAAGATEQRLLLSASAVYNLERG